jgi:hypothetical protein
MKWMLSEIKILKKLVKEGLEYKGLNFVVAGLII